MINKHDCNAFCFSKTTAKSFKPGEVYTIRVYAHSILGAGQPSQEIKYDVPGEQ